MGSSQSILTTLETVLKQRNIKVDRKTLRSFVKEVDRVAPWYALSGSLTLASWNKLGRDLDRHLEQRDLRIGTKAVWKLVKNCIEDEACQAAVVEGQAILEVTQDSMSETEQLEALNLGSSASSESSDSEQDSLGPGDETELEEEATKYEVERYHPDGEFFSKLLPKGKASAKAIATPSAPPMPLSPPPYEGRLHSFSFLPEKIRRKVHLTFPVFEVENGGRVHTPVEYKQIKELAELVRNYGPNANFTIMQIERLALDPLTPADWQMVVKAVLPNMGQYMEWRALWHEAAQSQARANAIALTPEQREWNFDLLTGQGVYAVNQINYPWGAYAQIATLVIRAWKSLTQKGKAGGQLTKIIQQPQEPFSDFVARMTEAAGRIFGDTEQVKPLIEQLIFEQATQECKTAIAPRKGKGLDDWLRVCRELGGPLTNAGLAAAILQSQRKPTGFKDRRLCFNCGKPGHLKKNVEL
ncbi:igE-binding protein-like [Mesocricetus auratus]|uniref:IgE-binding protein-like n=1 Tax=Mesocricetus auratus TaxID=10036 RepID=A0ABM2WGW3_MESAU|nr:igE-binding protein-like [Mesocricetus auratus]